MKNDRVQLIALETRDDAHGDRLDFETRFTAPTDTGEIEGVAVRFNTVDTYRTEFAPDAFRGLESRSVPMLWAHDPANVIGSWSSFQVRADGLTAKGKLKRHVRLVVTKNSGTSIAASAVLVKGNAAERPII